MAQYLDSTGLGTLVTQIKQTFYPKTNGNNDRSDINAILNGDKPLVTPEIVTSRWTVTKVGGGADNTVYSGNSIIVPTGSSVQYTGTWKWKTTPGYKDPETVSSGAWGSTKPASDTASAVCAVQSKTSTTATDATIAQVTLTAAKKGLMLSGQKVVKASGNDSTNASAVVKFRDCVYYGPVADVTPAGTAIAALSVLLLNTKQATVTATTTSSQYFCYAYPKDYGQITSIVADGADPIKDNFRAVQTVSVTNKAGLAKDYYVYVSVNKGAFSNNSLAFK